MEQKTEWAGRCFSCCPVHYGQGKLSALVFDPDKPGMVFCQKGCEMTLERFNQLLRSYGTHSLSI